MKPVRYIQPNGEKVRDKVIEAISLDEEVKILRETLAKVLEKVNISDDKEFQNYNNLIKGIKTKVKG